MTDNLHPDIPGALAKNLKKNKSETEQALDRATGKTPDPLIDEETGERRTGPADYSDTKVPPRKQGV